MHTCYGFYEIKQVESNNDSFYIYVNYMNRLVKLKCDKEEYDMVKSNQGEIFGIEFKYSSIWNEIGYVTHLSIE